MIKKFDSLEQNITSISQSPLSGFNVVNNKKRHLNENEFYYNLYDINYQLYVLEVQYHQFREELIKWDKLEEILSKIGLYNINMHQITYIIILPHLKC